MRVIGPALAVLALGIMSGDGAARPSATYRNPVLFGDYSDPDVVRVGDDYYLVASSFTNVPGLPILHSRDLVHWRLIGHALPRVQPDAHFGVPRRGGGVWAPAIRHHNGRFLIYFPDPDYGIQMVSAVDPRGPWSAPVTVDPARGAIDPAPFWDDDGQGWLVYAWAKSRVGYANIITLKALNADGTATVGESRTIVDGDKLPPVATSIGLRPWQTTEGPKLYKRDGWYYLFAPSGSVKGGWQGVFRSRNIAGPYEGRNVLDQGRTAINGPHQGAWVSTAAGEDWFLHFQDLDSYGRIVHLQPMRWRNGWPVIGNDPDGDGRGEPVLVHRAPRLPADPPVPVDTVDRFEGPLGLAWQWNSNPAADWIDPTASGRLRLKAITGSPNLWEVGNLLSQKLPAERFTATARVRIAPGRPGTRGGLAMFGAAYGWIGLERGARDVRIVQRTRIDAMRNGVETVQQGPVVADGPVWLRMRAEPIDVVLPPPDFSPYWPSVLKGRQARVTFSYSLDGARFVPLGEAFTSKPGRWVGAQIALFAQAPTGTPSAVALSVGHLDVEEFAIRVNE